MDYYLAFLKLFLIGHACGIYLDFHTWVIELFYFIYFYMKINELIYIYYGEQL